MFHEDSMPNNAEPYAHQLETPNTGPHADTHLKDNLEAERPTTNDDVEVPAEVRRITPASFYWTKDYLTGKPILAPQTGMAQYLAGEVPNDDSRVEDLANADSVRQMVRSLIKSVVDMLDQMDLIDPSGYLGNGQRRLIYQNAQQAPCEVIYWKDELASAVARAEKAGRKVSEDRSVIALSGFRDTAIRNAYLWSNLAVVAHDEGNPPLDYEAGAISFLRMRAASETKRLLGAQNAAFEAARDSQAAKALDPRLTARLAAKAAALKTAKAAA